MLIKFSNLLSNSSASFNDLKLFLLIKFLKFLSNSSVSSNSSLSLSSSYPNIACSNSLTICFKASLLTFAFTVLNSSRASFLFLTRSLFILPIKVRRVNNSYESLSPLYLEKTSEAIFLYNCKSFIHDKSIKLFLLSLSSPSSPLSSLLLSFTSSSPSSFPSSLGLGGLAGIITLPAKLYLLNYKLNFITPS